MFQVGHVYTHKRMLDVCMLILWVGINDNLRVRWFLKSGKSLSAPPDDIKIPDTQYEGWYEC